MRRARPRCSAKPRPRRDNGIYRQSPREVAVLGLGSLLLGAGTANAATAVFEGAVSIGRQLGLEVVAEGIESEEQLELVRKAGCTHVQGYLLSSPLSPEEVERYFDINCAEPNSQGFERRQA